VAAQEVGGGERPTAFGLQFEKGQQAAISGGHMKAVASGVHDGSG
jgi:hypothetical protein